MGIGAITGVRAAALSGGRRAAKALVSRVDPGTPGDGSVVLIYHRVGAGTSSQIDLPVAAFREQVAELAAAGRVTTLDGALGASGPGPTGDPVALTFDDGTADFLDHALPVLVEFQVPVLLYLATSFCDEGLSFDGHRMVTWTGLRDALSTGLVTIGSHTHRHRLLDRLPPGEIDDELDRSVKLIEDHLGVHPEHFAYPKAVAPSPAAAAAVARRFRTAALAGTRPNPYGRMDPQQVWRSPIQTADGMRGFRAKCNGGMGLEDRIRSRIHRVTYRGKSS